MAGDFEQALTRLEADAVASQRAAEVTVRAAKRLSAAAKVGDVAAIEKGLAEADRAVAALREQQNNTRQGWTFDANRYIETDEYQRELMDSASEEGLALHEQDRRIFSYPVLLQILRGQDIGAITIDRKRVRTLRPSYLVRQLRMLAEKPPKSNPTAFLKSLYQAYSWAEHSKPNMGASARGPVVELLDLYEILTIFPGMARDYSRQEFTRDLYLLDISSLREFEGASFELSASTGTRTSRYLRMIDKQGEEKAYYAISFTRVGRR